MVLNCANGCRVVQKNPANRATITGKLLILRTLQLKY
uniref:Uncharacterized protein n=1 Tax=Rhizophora mucronata TaxID=61149 RepID=A0A2P2QI71_RHIMU